MLIEDLSYAFLACRGSVFQPSKHVIMSTYSAEHYLYICNHTIIMIFLLKTLVPNIAILFKNNVIRQCEWRILHNKSTFDRFYH